MQRIAGDQGADGADRPSTCRAPRCRSPPSPGPPGWPPTRPRNNIEILRARNSAPPSGLDATWPVFVGESRRGDDVLARDVPETWMWAEACATVARAERLHRSFFEP